VDVVNNKNVNPIQRIQSALITQNYLCDPDTRESSQTLLEGSIKSFIGLAKDLYNPAQEDLGLIPVGLQILSDTFKNNDFNSNLYFCDTLYNEKYQKKVIDIGIDGMTKFISSGIKGNVKKNVLEAFVFTLSDILSDNNFQQNLLDMNEEDEKNYLEELQSKVTNISNQVENYHLQ
jgi:hypothetical protein